MNQVQIRVVFDRKHEATKKKAALVQLECRFEGKRKFVSTGIKLCAHQFKNGRIIQHDDADRLNKRINDQIAEINHFVDSINEQHLVFSLQLLDNINSSYCQFTFLQFMEQRIEQRIISDSTKKQHRKVLRWLKEYRRINSFTDLTLPNLILMDETLKRTTYEDGRRMMQTTVHTYHKVLKCYINEAIRLEIITDNPYSRFKCNQGQARQRTILSMEELDLIKNYRTKSILQAKVRDLFIVQCYTGLAYADLMAADWTAVERIGENYIIKDVQRQKTGTQYMVILLPEVMKILRRYGGKMPRLSYDVYNRWLKAVAAAAGITKTVTTHIGRHTFATTIALGSNIPIEVVSKMLGHKDIKTTQIYAKILPETLLDNFEKIKQRIS